MIDRETGILRSQETHRTLSEYYITEAGFLLIFSGTAEDELAETAGAGLLASPTARRTIIGFKQASSRMASLKLRAAGGKIVVCSAHAPRRGERAEERRDFFQELDRFLGALSRHGPALLRGDFNGRIRRRRLGEEPSAG